MEKVKKGRSYTYILKGEPESLALKRSDNLIGWNNSKERKLITNITLDAQHNHRPIFTGSVAVDIQFYFQVPKSPRAKRKAEQGDLYPYEPSILLCFHFIENSALGIIFRDPITIVSLSCNKLFDEEPRTVITVTELYEKKGNNPKEG